MRLEGVTILTIIVDQDSRKLLKSVLNQAGATAIEADCGAQGLRKFGNSHVDLVICDLQMPDLDGYQVLKGIRLLEQKEGGIVPVIAVAAFESLEDYSESRDGGFDFFLVKPINPDELIRAIEGLLGWTPDF